MEIQDLATHCVLLTSRKVNMLQLVSHQAHVVGGRSGKRQEAGQTHPFEPPMEEKPPCKDSLLLRCVFEQVVLADISLA